MTSPGRPKSESRSKRNLGASSRTTVWLKDALRAAIAKQAEIEGNSSSGLISDILEVLLRGPVGQQLVRQAHKNRRTLAQEIERNLILFADRVPTEEILELAEASYRTQDEMLIRLVLRGLESYRQEED